MPENSLNIRNGSWRAEQSRLLIMAPVKFIEAETGLHRDTLYDLKNSIRPATAVTAFQISAAQHDYTYLQILAERARAVLLPRLIIPPKRPTLLLLADFALRFGRFFELAEKHQRGETLTDEEQRELEQNWEEMKQTGDAYVERSREKRREQE